MADQIPTHDQRNAAAATRVRVVILGAGGGVDDLTYELPPALAGRVSVGHRVLVPLRSRKLTGIVVEVGENLEAGGVAPRTVLELLEARPLFDRAHLALIDFLANYYMAPLGEAYRNVIPASARVESRRMFRIGTTAAPLAAAAFTRTEAAIVEALAKRPLTLRQLERLGEQKAVEAALARLLAEGFVERHDATRGRHRESPRQIVRLTMGGPAPTVRGTKQREIIRRLNEAGPGGVPLGLLESQLGTVKAALRPMEKRGIIEIASPPFAHDQDLRPIANNQSLAGSGGGETTADMQPGSGDAVPSPLELTWEQAAAIDAAAPAVRERRFETFLLWGVTASGKTEVYLRLAATALAIGRQVIVLVPEIALADQLVRAFRLHFGSLVAIAHSAQNVAERWGSWMAALSGEARVMIGPRSAIFAPLHDAGLIVVDEEHDTAYKQEEGIRYNARDLAVALGRFSQCPVVLGSATPSAESFLNARRGRYKLLRLSRRVGDREFAKVEIIDLRQHRATTALIDAAAAADADQTAARNAVPLAPPLVEALKGNLAGGGQSIVFLNRRGYHNFLQCHLCGNVIACSNCSVSMTFHLRDRTLRCHYCGANAEAPEKCPECAGFGLEGQGFGTERLVHVLQQLLPGACIERMDSDTGGRRGARSAIMDALRRGEIDILVGTQMITKGFDFPGVTLVGVVLADASLNLPDFRSAERTFQLLTQVAGRAGRGDKPGRVLIQTYAPHHYSIRAASEQDYARFMRRELELRRELMYPPFARMALVRIEGGAHGRVSEVASRAAAFLERIARPDSIRVLGPAPAPIERIRQRYRWQVVVKSAGLNEMRAALSSMRAEVAGSAERAEVRLAIDVDPVNML